MSTHNAASRPAVTITSAPAELTPEQEATRRAHLDYIASPDFAARRAAAIAATADTLPAYGGHDRRSRPV